MTVWGFVTVAMAVGGCTIRVSSSEALKKVQGADKVGI